MLIFQELIVIITKASRESGTVHCRGSQEFPASSKGSSGSWECSMSCMVTLDWARGDFDRDNSVPPLRFSAYEGSSSFGLSSRGALFASRGAMCEGVTSCQRESHSLLFSFH